MVSWVWNFVHEYADKEHAYPVIYSTTDWWSTCTGNYLPGDQDLFNGASTRLKALATSG